MMEAKSVNTNNLSVHCDPTQAKSEGPDLRAFHMKVPKFSLKGCPCLCFHI